jgi:hypothetical protein
MNELELLAKAQEFRIRHKVIQSGSEQPLSAGQIRVLKNGQNFSTSSIYVLILEVKYSIGGIRVALIDSDTIYATPFDIVLKKQATGAPFDVTFIPTLSNWVEFSQLVDQRLRGSVNPVMSNYLVETCAQGLVEFSNQVLPEGWELGEINIQPGDHAWLNRSLLVEKFYDFTRSKSSIMESSSELTTSWLYMNCLVGVNSYDTLFEALPEVQQEGSEDAFNIDQARLMDMQIRGDRELVSA